MLNKLRALTVKADGRYAAEQELQFIEAYLHSFPDRLLAYRKIQDSETDIVNEVYRRLQKQSPQFFQRGGQDYTPKWRSDTVRVLRFTAMAILYDDADLYKERFLYWFQTIMSAFSLQEACNQTYTVMQEVVKDMLPPTTANLLCPFLELTRTVLAKLT